MHIASGGIVTRSLHAAYWGDRYAVYSERGGLGLILARFNDGHSLFFQGDDADILRGELEKYCDAAAENAPGDSQAEIDAIDRCLDEYAVIEEWSSPAEANGAPSSDGGLFNFYA